MSSVSGPSGAPDPDVIDLDAEPAAPAGAAVATPATPQTQPPISRIPLTNPAGRPMPPMPPMPPEEPPATPEPAAAEPTEVIDLDLEPPVAAPAPAAPSTPAAPAAPPPKTIEEQRRELVEGMRKNPAWAAVPAGTQGAIDRVLTTSGTPAVADALGKLVSQSGFATRLSELGQQSLVDLVRRNPAGAAQVNSNYGELSNLVGSDGYDRLASEDRERALRVLADKPFIGKVFGPLLNNPTFRGLDQSSKSQVLDRIDRSPADRATGTVLVEQMNLNFRAAAANGKAQEALKYLKVLEGGESGWSALGVGLLTGGAGALGLAGANYFGQDVVKDKIADLLSGPDANDVYRAIERNGEGKVHDLMEQLLESPGDGDTRGRLVKILDKLDADNAAKFISNMAHGIGKELEKEKIFDAVAKGFSLSANVNGVDVGIQPGGVISVGAPEFDVQGVKVKDLKLGFDPNPLREALERQKDKNYRNLLTEVLDSFTKNHELMSSPERWSDRQMREYFDAIRRLPGGAGASDLTAAVGRPNFRQPTSITPAGGAAPGANPP